ncbi:MAG: CYTH domain-containing protein [Candidatus Moraniibacteriota bacterium]|nr:MAG: CYTH domain-containing protein [Candidatus Moranbacteria bacterium]
MAHFEIEIKSLLGKEENADSLKEKLQQLPEPAHLIRTSSQLNHYFLVGNWETFLSEMGAHFSEKSLDHLRHVIREGKNHSVRTRQSDGKVLLVVKASIDDTTSSNGISRMEFEEEVSKLSLDELDVILLKSGFEYQAKWSRDREEYKTGNISVCLDRNAGYGYVAEFEKIVGEAHEAEGAKRELLEFMEKLGIEELPQDRLERMFAHYNAHWSEYYGTEKIFVID